MCLQYFINMALMEDHLFMQHKKAWLSVSAETNKGWNQLKPTQTLFANLFIKLLKHILLYSTFVDFFYWARHWPDRFNLEIFRSQWKFCRREFFIHNFCAFSISFWETSVRNVKRNFLKLHLVFVNLNKKEANGALYGAFYSSHIVFIAFCSSHIYSFYLCCSVIIGVNSEFC